MSPSLLLQQSTVDVRQNILAPGQRIMVAKGFSAAGITQILTSAEASEGSFYHDLGSKNAFGGAVLANYGEDYLSEAVCLAMTRRTSEIIGLLSAAIETGIAEGSLSIDGDPGSAAQSLYHLCLRRTA